MEMTPSSPSLAPPMIKTGNDSAPKHAAHTHTGEYVAKWVPELSKLRKPHIHQPWSAPAAALEAAGVALGETYPHRVVPDVAAARADADRGVREARAAAAADARDADGYDMIRVPAGAISVRATGCGCARAARRLRHPIRQPPPCPRLVASRILSPRCRRRRRPRCGAAARSGCSLCRSTG